MSDFNHIYLEGFTSSLPYSPFKRKIGSINTGVSRSDHGGKLRQSFSQAVEELTEDDDFEFVYIEFESTLNFELALDRFDDAAGNIRLASCKKIIVEIGEELAEYYRAAVYLNKSAVSAFLKKLEEYLNEDTKTGKPRHQSLVANIEEIRAATLESFWQDDDSSFPESGTSVWWEVWFTSLENEKFDEQVSILIENNVSVGSRVLRFPENTIALVKATKEELANTLLNFDNLSELRKPAEAADFFTNLSIEWELEFIADLKARTTDLSDVTKISVSLLDSGVNRTNPLLEELISEEDLETINPTWTKADSFRSGHGTQMAGLILYGDLVNPLNSSTSINVLSKVESIKIIDVADNDPQLYGQITLEAIATGEVMNPENKRVICLAVTSSINDYSGKPSSWSGAVDQRLFGTILSRNNELLVVVSSGNLPLEDRLTSPLSNDDFSIEDPAQSFNSITVGSCTDKDYIDFNSFPDAQLLANKGAMSPSNTTSIKWENQWANKPDIVMEGGNDGLYQDGILDVDSLKLLSTGTGGVGRSWLTTFSDTSASTALAAKFAAQLYSKYPDYRPETIRALIIHSANWNDAMLNKPLNDYNKDEKRDLLSRVGYGVPNLQRALFSAENSLTIISERTLLPFKYEDSRVQMNEFHLFDIPWPTDVLLELAELEVTLKVTLSYFIEPNPGNKMYASPISYQSHGLRFQMIDKNESEELFKARVSKTIREERGEYIAEGSEKWILGSQVRDKGSVHKDIWQGSAADLALRNKLAVHPVGGWWKNRKKLKRYTNSVNYSIIISIESEKSDIDIYTPVLNKIDIPIAIVS